MQAKPWRTVRHGDGTGTARMRWRLKSRWASEARQGKCHRRMARAALKAKPEGGEAAGAAQAGRWLGGGASGAAHWLHRHGAAVRSAWRRSSARHARSCAAQGAQRSLQLVHWARPHRPRAGPSTLRALASSSSAGCARGVTRCARAAHALRTRRARCPARPRARPRPAARQRCLARPSARGVPYSRVKRMYEQVMFCVVVGVFSGCAPAQMHQVNHRPPVGLHACPGCGVAILRWPHIRAASQPVGAARSRSRCAGRWRGDFWGAARRFCGGGVGGARRFFAGDCLWYAGR